MSRKSIEQISVYDSRIKIMLKNVSKNINMLEYKYPHSYVIFKEVEKNVIDDIR